MRDVRFYMEVFVKCQTDQPQESYNSGVKSNYGETRVPLDHSKLHKRLSQVNDTGQHGTAGRRGDGDTGVPMRKGRTRMRPPARYHECNTQAHTHDMTLCVFLTSQEI